MHDLNLTQTQKILLNLTAMSMSETPEALLLSETELIGADWKEIVEESVSQSVTLATFNAVTLYRQYISEDTYKVWKNLSMAIFKTDFDVLLSQVDLVSILGKKYPYVILKGTAAAAYYPNPEIRALGDVDFLIDVKQQAEIEDLLIKHDYQKCCEDHPNHVVFKKLGAHLEMHFDVAGIPNGTLGDEVRAFLQKVLAEPIEGKQDICNFLAPQNMYHGLVLLLHMQHHMLGEGFGLRHLSDWGVYVARTQKEPYWEQTLLPFLKKIGMFTYAAVMTKTCAKYLSTPCPVWAEEADEQTCDEIMQDILTGGNFGRKDRFRASSGIMISDRKCGTKKGKLRNLATVLHKSVQSQEVVRKAPVLYPFVYVWRAIRYAVLMLFGRRPSLLKMAPEAEKRKAVYKKLKVFEVNNKEV